LSPQHPVPISVRTTDPRFGPGARADLARVRLRGHRPARRPPARRPTRWSARGYGEAYAQLERDPCAPHLAAYRLAGPLEPAVCGLHLRNGWRLAFTMQPPERRRGRHRVIILLVARRGPRHRASDAWTILQDLFAVGNPPEAHHKLPCCQAGVPDLSDDALDRLPARGAPPHPWPPQATGMRSQPALRSSLRSNRGIERSQRDASPRIHRHRAPVSRQPRHS
jgi:hypothetical protein